MEQFLKQFNLNYSNRTNPLYLASCAIASDMINHVRLSQFLTPTEIKQINQSKYQSKKHSLYLSRISAKFAISPWNPDLSLSEIQISNGVFSQPFIQCSHIQNISISITHCKNIGVTVSYPEELLIGVDLEVSSKQIFKIISRQLTTQELTLFNAFSLSQEHLSTILWTAKEALSKALHIGFTSELRLFAISSIRYVSNQYICQFQHFPQFKAYSISFEGFILTIVLPYHAKPNPSFSELVPIFSELTSKI